MKFSDIDSQQWEELKPYLDTCLLPVTGLSGVEQPWQAAQSLERLRDALDLIEIPYQGRVVTYPAFHYIDTDDDASLLLNRVCQRLKTAGFKYVIVVTVGDPFGKMTIPAADIHMDGADLDAWPPDRIRTSIESLWHGETEQGADNERIK